MKKIYYFLRWIFDFSRWHPFQKRYTIYAIVGIVIALVTKQSELFWLPAVFVWIDFTFCMLKEKWDNFNKEQTEMFDNIKGKK